MSEATHDEDRLATARGAVAEADWAAALAALDGIEDDALLAEAFELRATANYGAGEFEAAVEAWEGLHALLVERAEPAGAAQAAAMIAMYLMMDTGMMAPVRGWLRRAEQLLVGLDEVPAHALVAMTRTYERFMSGDMAEAAIQAARAKELGSRLGVTPAVVIGGVASARVRILNGEVTEGLDELDEIGAMLMAGEADPLTTGMMYCELICAAQGLALHARAREWTEVMERWRHGAAFGGINGRCRVHRAEMLRISGPCDAAESEALLACEELRPWMRREFGWPLTELGMIRLRKGDLSGASEAFVDANEHAWNPHPGMALLRLEQGDVDAAAALIADAIEHPMAIPSKERPPYGDLWMAPLLEAQAEIAAARGDREGARRAATALATIAAEFPGPGLEASAALTEARTLLLEDDPAGAMGPARAAIALWAELGAPYESSTARTVLVDALERSGNQAGADLELRAAAAGFRAYGALRRAAELDARLAARSRIDDPQSDTAPSSGRGVFRLDGDTRIVGMGGRSTQLRDLVGHRYIERMLAEPDREFHALDLVAVEHGTVRSSNPAPQAGIPVLDDRAREAYRRRLIEIDEDIAEAEQNNDEGRRALAERDRQYLMAELERAVGLSGRQRTTGGTAERARTSVTRSIRYALDRLEEHDPTLAGHLRRGIRTGTYCAYEPDPAHRVVWDCGDPTQA